MPHRSTDHIATVLSRTPLLRTLSSDEIAALARHARVVHFNPGALVWAKGTLGTHAYWVLKGRVKVSATARNGHDLLLRMIEPGEVFGEVSAIERGPRSTNATAETHTDGFSIASHPLVAVIERSPMFEGRLMTMFVAPLPHVPQKKAAAKAKPPAAKGTANTAKESPAGAKASAATNEQTGDATEPPTAVNEQTADPMEKEKEDQDAKT